MAGTGKRIFAGFASGFYIGHQEWQPNFFFFFAQNVFFDNEINCIGPTICTIINMTDL